MLTKLDLHLLSPPPTTKQFPSIRKPHLFNPVVPTTDVERSRFLSGAQRPGLNPLGAPHIASDVTFLWGFYSKDLAALKCLPSGDVKIAIENGHFLVDFPMKHGDFHS